MTFFKTDDYAGIAFDVSDLMAVSVRGDNPGWKQLQAFKDAWDETLSGMEKDPATDILEALLKGKIKRCQLMTIDVAAYDRAERTRYSGKNLSFSLRCT